MQSSDFFGSPPQFIPFWGVLPTDGPVKSSDLSDFLMMSPLLTERISLSLSKRVATGETDPRRGLALVIASRELSSDYD